MWLAAVTFDLEASASSGVLSNKQGNHLGVGQLGKGEEGKGGKREGKGERKGEGEVNKWQEEGRKGIGERERRE